jgi:hypothetical protein
MKAATEPEESYTILIQQSFAEVLVNNATNEKSLHLTKKFKVGDVVSEFSADTVSTVGTYTN